MSFIEKKELVRLFPKEDYYEDLAISHSDLSIFRRYGFEGEYRRKHQIGVEKEEPTPAMDLGSLVHCMLLTPELVDKEYYVFEGKKPASKNMEEFCKWFIELDDEVMAYDKSYVTNTMKADDLKKKSKDLRVSLQSYIDSIRFLKDNPKIKLIDRDMWDQAKAMKESAESTYLWKRIDEEVNKRGYKVYIEDGNRFKLGLYKDHSFRYRFDLLLTNKPIEEATRAVLLDIKTTNTAGIDFIDNSFYKYNYDTQLAMYNLGLKTNYPNIEYIASHIIAINKEKPYTACSFIIEGEVIDKATEKLKTIIDTYVNICYGASNSNENHDTYVVK